MREYSAAAKRFYDSTAWIKCRKAYIASVFGLCEKCKRPGTILHHKIEIDDSTIGDPEVTLNHDNLTYLCIECHNDIHAGRNVTRDDVRFEDGQLVEV